MHNIDLILTLTGGLAAALACGYVTFRIGLSPIVGYLLAGLVVGPHTPGFVANESIAEQFSEVGVILLMFGVGLQFHLKELLAVWHVAVPGALGRTAVITLLGAFVGRAYGWGWPGSFVFGIALSVASTVVLMRVLADNGDLHTRTGHVAVGWLVVEDLLTVLILVFLPAMFTPGASAGQITLALGLAVAKLGLMIALMFVVGERAIPWLLDRIAATRSRELFTLTVLVLALGIAVGSAKLFGVSMALGAFLAGMVVGRSEFSLRAATDALPMRDAFAVLFFVSVGMLFRPRYLIENPGLIGVTLAVVLLAKPAVALLIVLWRKQPLRTAVALAVTSAQIGEFSFILAATGKQLRILDDQTTNTLIAAAIITITLSPLLYHTIAPLERLLRRFVKPPAPSESLVAIAAGQFGESSESGCYQVVVIGAGPVGRTLTRLLQENRFEPVIVELNLDTVRQLGSQKIRAIYGDATHADTLEQAGVKEAVGLILTSANTTGVRETIRVARELNPQILIVARSEYLRDHRELRDAGADVAFSGEGEVAMAMTEFFLRHLGATDDQVDRERDRVRSEFFGDACESRVLPDDRSWPSGNLAGTGRDGAPRR
jgi:CPA2 family monovalent cation:H+ antiporter-2